MKKSLYKSTDWRKATLIKVLKKPMNIPSLKLNWYRVEIGSSAICFLNRSGYWRRLTLTVDRQINYIQVMHIQYSQTAFIASKIEQICRLNSW